MLEALGFDLAMAPERIERSIDELGFGFLFAQAHHPAMKYAGAGAARARGADGLQRARPADEPGRRAGAGRRRLRRRGIARTIADALVRLDARRAYVVHGAGGIDELSPAGPNLVCEVDAGSVREYELDPLELGVPRCDPAELRGGDADDERAGAARRARRARPAATARRCC